MEASDHPHDSTEENQTVDVPVQTAPSTFHANKDFEADSDPMAKGPEVLAKGLSTMLSTIIRDFDCRAQETFKSQDQLCFALDRLTRDVEAIQRKLELNSPSSLKEAYTRLS
ncbi:putative snapin/Pallidin/Snn1 [Senna tora]|uniref:Biogenesis of lysosome-related organelles complex 1 subunit 7 n=1 Tax=Senna tora TaxID=362788 RepID=A0A834WMQ0_9FABA|nr:putative snapin/Pallidin/Snn1 [Senna tora]